ncbi:hypothetical protein AAHA92_17214 [Salvia divinorum]|uniref:Uncharacterized protein n=1 Tax=Salvia divinorum TaxID=28513 RepID=A0ABD1GY27_SALDI
MAGKIPPPIPTAKGVRSAADTFLSEQIDRSIQTPELKLPQHVARSKPDDITYQSLLLREDDTVRGLMRSLRDFGAVRISGHGILTEDLRFALANSDRIFTVQCCHSYGDHEQIDWPGDDHRIAQEAVVALGVQNYQIFRQKMDNATIELEGIAKELANVIATCKYKNSIELGGSKLRIYRYHRANIIDRNSSIFTETSQESVPYALSLHLFLDPGEFCLETSSGLVSFETKPESLVLTTGNEFEVMGLGEINSAEGKYMHNPFLKTGRSSFSLRQIWTVSKLNHDPVISLWDQILILFAIVLIYKFFSYIFY